MVRFVFFIVLLILSLNSSAQIKGAVIDSKTKKPLAFASVQIQSTGKGTFTNNDGVFILPSFKDKDTILVRYLGYKDKYVVSSNEDSFVVKLEPKIIKLSEVKIINYDEKYLAQIIHDCIVNKTYSGKTTNCKSFVKVNTYQNDTILREAFEAFFNTEVDAFSFKRNSFKNGILLSSKYKGNKIFKSTDLFSTIIPRLNIYTKPLQNNTNNGEIQYIRKINAHIKLQSPIHSYYISNINEDFSLTALKLDNKTLRINYYSKQDTNVYGYLIIDLTNKELLEFDNNSFFANELPIESAISGYVIQNLILKTRIVFNNNTPHLLNLKFVFDYKNTRTNEIEKISLTAIQLLYDFNNSFSRIQPSFVSNYDDYSLLSITPIIPELWKNESLILKSAKENLQTAKMIKFNNNTSDLSVWNNKWTLDWKRATVIDPSKNQFHRKKYKLIKLNAFILLNYYKLEDRFIIKSATVFNYSNLNIYEQQKTAFMKLLIEKYFNLLHSSSENLITELNNTPKLTEKEILKHYKRTIKKEKKIKRAFKKEQRRYLINLKHNGE